MSSNTISPDTSQVYLILIARTWTGIGTTFLLVSLPSCRVNAYNNTHLRLGFDQGGILIIDPDIEAVE